MSLTVYVGLAVLGLVSVLLMLWIYELQKAVSLLFEKSDLQKVGVDLQLQINAINDFRLTKLEESS